MQQTQLYLDTARIGPMSPRAAQAHVDFARLAAQEAGSLFFERFLQAGAGAWSATVCSRYPGLAEWRGVGPLKAAFRQLVGSHADLPVLLVNRTTQLMKLAARLFFGPCRNVLVTDLGWPPYHDLLVAAARRVGRRITTAPLHDGVLRDGWGEAEILRVVQDHFQRGKCDGLFLGAVSHLGVRLPAEPIIRMLEIGGKARFVVIDGAQDFCHVRADSRMDYCDLYITGCHKWLGAGNPMGLGFYGRRRSQSVIESHLARLLAVGEIDDPLLRFTSQLEDGNLDRTTETVNVMPLFSSHGATADALGRHPWGFSERLSNAARIASQAAANGWQPALPTESLRTGILMLQASRPEVRRLPAGQLRERFAHHGIALTAFERGVVRLSLPNASWRNADLDLLTAAFAS